MKLFRLTARSECNVNLFHFSRVLIPRWCLISFFLATILLWNHRNHFPNARDPPLSLFFHSSLATFFETIRFVLHHGKELSSGESSWTETPRSSCSIRWVISSDLQKSFLSLYLTLIFFGWALVLSETSGVEYFARPFEADCRDAFDLSGLNEKHLELELKLYTITIKIDFVSTKLRCDYLIVIN